MHERSPKRSRTERPAPESPGHGTAITHPLDFYSIATTSKSDVSTCKTLKTLINGILFYSGALP